MDTLKETLTQWAATRPDDVVFDPKKGFYSFDVITDVWEKGVAKGKDAFKLEVREKYYNNIKLVVEATNKLLGILNEKGFTLEKLFINHSVGESMVLLSVKEEIHNTKDFIDFAYVEASKIEIEFYKKDIHLDFGFIDDAPSIDYTLLRTDGYGFLYDLNSGKEINN